MKLLFTGTGASDWAPKLKKDDEYRRFSSVLLDGKLMIDPGPHIFDFESTFGYKNLYTDATDIILTHSHDDHLNIKNLKILCASKRRNIWCHTAAAKTLKDIGNLRVNEIALFSPIQINGYTVTALPANHQTGLPGEQALHYMIQQDNKAIFYGCDGAWLKQETWYYMRDYQFDLIILDGTLGDGDGDYRIFEHNNLKMVELMTETIRNTNVLKGTGQIMISHLAFYPHEKQIQVEQRLSPANIKVAFDGCEIEL